MGPHTARPGRRRERGDLARAAWRAGTCHARPVRPSTPAIPPTQLPECVQQHAGSRAARAGGRVPQQCRRCAARPPVRRNWLGLSEQIARGGERRQRGALAVPSPLVHPLLTCTGLQKPSADWQALAEPHDADAAVGSALPPAALLRRLQLAADPAAVRAPIAGPEQGAGLEEASRRAGRSLLFGLCYGCSTTKKPPSPPWPPEP